MLWKKFQFNEEKTKELEQTYAGKEKLKERIFNSLTFWKDTLNPGVTMNQFIRLLRVVGFMRLAEEVRAIKVYSQIIKL